MLYEFAIDPEAILEWAKDRNLAAFFLDGKFGLGTARIMAQFPKGWRKRVHSFFGQGSGTLADSRLGEILKELGSHVTARPASEWCDDLPWLENTEREDLQSPFHAILGVRNPRLSSRVLNALSPGEVVDSPLWKTQHGVTVKRTADEIAEAISPMLRIADEIYFIDPYFDPGTKKKRDPILKSLRRAEGSRGGSAPRIIQVRCDYDKSGTDEYFQCKCKEDLPKKIPKGWEVVFLRLNNNDSGQRLHNRYILTNLGGVIFGHGIDEGKRDETDEITLLSKDQYWKQRAAYIDQPVFMESGQRIVVRGTRCE
ncbi:MAG: hypothetical protein GHCLOJNM_03637 [bacterium]|nr:hypothetical protein [bacterium]